jgi:hypothetical protein
LEAGIGERVLGARKGKVAGKKRVVPSKKDDHQAEESEFEGFG